MNTGYTFGEYKVTKSRGAKSGTEVDTVSPIKINLPPEKITIKVPKIQKVVVPKIKKVYIPSNEKIYIKKSSLDSSNNTNISYISSEVLPNENTITSMIDLSNQNPIQSISYVPNPLKKSSSSISIVPNPLKSSSSYISMVPNPIIKPSSSISMVPNPISKSSSSISMVPNPITNSISISKPIKSLVPEPVLSYKHMPKEQILVNSTIPEVSMPMISQVPYPVLSRHKSSKGISLDPTSYNSTYKPLSRHLSSNMRNKVIKFKHKLYPNRAYNAKL